MRGNQPHLHDEHRYIHCEQLKHRLMLVQAIKVAPRWLAVKLTGRQPRTNQQLTGVAVFDAAA
jgi:hypothetical protein